MIKMKKTYALVMAGIMGLSLTACGSSGNTGDGNATDSTTKESTAGDTASATENASGDALSVMIWDTYQEPGLKQIMDDFTKETGIPTQIQVVTWNEYWTLLEAGAQGGSMPDVFWMHSNEAQRYMENDMLLDLTDKIKDSDKLDMSKFIHITIMFMQFQKTLIPLHFGITKRCLMKQVWHIRMIHGPGIPLRKQQRN